MIQPFIALAGKGQSWTPIYNIMVYGDGQQTRSFCYVDDLVDGHPLDGDRR